MIAFFSLLTYIKLIRASKFSLEEEEAKKVTKMILPYAMVTIVTSISFCAFNIFISNAPGGCIQFLSGIFLSIKSLQGALDAIVFSFNPTAKEEMKKYFNKNNETNNNFL